MKPRRHTKLICLALPLICFAPHFMAMVQAVSP